MTKPGTYKLAAKTFRANGNTEIADALENGTLKLAVTHTITGNVTRRPELTGPFMEAIAMCHEMDPDDRCHYLDMLADGSSVPVNTGNAVVYPYGSKAPEMPGRVYGPGELFMKS